MFRILVSGDVYSVGLLIPHAETGGRSVVQSRDQLQAIRFSESNDIIGIMNFYPDAGWRRFLFVAPIVLWRLGLAPVVGRLFVLLTTSGRKSGLPRRAMLEYFRSEKHLYVVSAFGAKAHWYQNLLADPRVVVQSARGAQTMRATRVTDDEELLTIYEFFLRRYPPFIGAFLNALGIENNPADVVAKKERLHFVRLEESEEAAPPPLKADLVWVWLVVLAIAGAGLWLFLR